MPDEAIVASILFTFIVMLLTAVIAIRCEEQFGQLDRRLTSLKLGLDRLDHELQNFRQKASDDRKEIDRIAALEKADIEDLRNRVAGLASEGLASERRAES